MTIRVLSFGFDGCLFNHSYVQSGRNIVKANKKLLDFLKKDNAKFSETVAFIGSNRQSKRVDGRNAGEKNDPLRTESSFSAIQSVCDYLDVSFNPFLMADIYGQDLDEGDSHARAIDPNYKGEHADWLFDGSKVSLLYAQMHKIAFENPTEKIVFDFYDDRGFITNDNGILQNDILENLEKFYSRHPHLIPKNVTLVLHHYAGQEEQPFPELKGTGFIDSNYAQTVKDMGEQAKTGAGHDGTSDPLYFEAHIKPANLLNRRPMVAPAISAQGPLKEGATFPKSYTKLWTDAQESSNVRRVKALLKDYTKTNSVMGSRLGLFFSGHWNRHHVKKVQEIIEQQHLTTGNLLSDLHAINRKENGSLDRRIQFIEKMLRQNPQSTNNARLSK